MNIHRKNRHKLTGIILMMVGSLFLVGGLVLALFPTSTVQAYAPPEDAEYLGARECRECHRDLGSAHSDSRHALTFQGVSQEDMTAIVADFNQGDDVRTMLFPGESEARVMTAADIVFTIGSGHHAQRYVYQTPEGQYMVLPVEWNVLEQKWQTFTLDETWPSEAYDWNTNCVACHTTGYDVSQATWVDEGVQCESCHGPGSVHADLVDHAGPDISDEEMAEIRSSIVLSPDPQICGQCHGQGTSQANTPYPVGYIPGMDLLDPGIFTLVAPNDPAHWWASGHGKSQNMQFNEWVLSGHAMALDTMRNSNYADESCLECHSGDYHLSLYMQERHVAGGSEGLAPIPINLETAQYGVTCTTCHTMHSEDAHEYQLVNEPYELCVSCHGDTDRIAEVHAPVEEMYEGLEILSNIQGTPSGHFEQDVECITCHMPPTRISGEFDYFRSHTLTLAEPGVVEEGQPNSCNGCHTDLSSEYMQQFLEKTQSGIQDRLSAARVVLGNRADVPEWVHTALDFVFKDGSLGVHNYAYATSLLTAAEVQLGISASAVPESIPTIHIENPLDCAECHEAEYNEWHSSPHANASLSQQFQQLYAENGRPSYCMRCHASGYDPQIEQYVFEGVVCSNCHYITEGSEHPPGPVEIATDSAVCGRCHSGEHAPTYDEWLVSSHSGSKAIDCVDCHTAHDNGLKMGTVNDTCGSCHQEAMVDEIHMGEDMDCADCHMNRVTTANGIQVVQTGHTMSIDPGVCAACHGDTHMLSANVMNLSEEEINELETMREEVAHLEEQAAQNLNNGIVGGAVGALVLAVVVFFTIRLGRLK